MSLTQFRFGISQGHGGSTLIEGARIFADLLGPVIGQRARLVVESDYKALLMSVLAGNVELSWMPPFLHIEATARGHRLVVVCERGGAVTYRSALLVRNDSKFRAVSDLLGERFRVAWSDPASAAGCVFPRLHLAQQGIDPKDQFVSERFYGGFMAACEAVAAGEADVCACSVAESSIGEPAQILAEVKRVFAAAEWRLRTLDVTRPIPADGLVIASHVDAGLEELLLRTIYGMHLQPGGKQTLSKLFYADKLVRVPGYLSNLIETLRPLLPCQA